MRIIYFLVVLSMVTLIIGCVEDIPPQPMGEKEMIEPEKQEAVIKPTTALKTDECWDGVCGRRETFAICPNECAETCGDGIVQDNENWKNCRYDLLYTCGNGICESWEHYQYCSSDCEACIIDEANRYNGDDECPPNERWVN